jgi:hypothetical protein
MNDAHWLVLPAFAGALFGAALGALALAYKTRRTR